MKRHNLFKLVLVLALALSVGAGVSRAQDLQERIDKAVPGEIVSLEPGTFLGPISLREGVILSGAGSGVTFLDGQGAAAAIEGAPDSVISGLTVSNASVGIRNGGHRIAVISCEFRDNPVSAVYAGGGECVLVDNLVRGPGRIGFQVSAAAVLVANNTVLDKEIGLQFWQAPLGLVANNILAGNQAGVRFETEPRPAEFSNNDFWGNSLELYSGQSAPGNLYLDPELTADFDLSETSPLRGAGIPIAGVPFELTFRVGCDPTRELTGEECASLLEALRELVLSWSGVLTYTLTDEPGVFGVSVAQAAPDFRIVSSAAGTAISEVEAFDRVSDADLDSRVLETDPAGVEVEGKGWESYPREKERYVMDSTFSRPASLLLTEAGLLRFRRQTNMRRIRIVPPPGWETVSCFPEARMGEAGLELENSPGEMIEIDLLLRPAGD